MNWAQEKLFDNLWYFNLVLKARQIGITTFFCLLYLDDVIFSGVDAGLIAHTLQDAKKIFDTKVRYAWESLPKVIKDRYEVNADSARELKFKQGKIESSIYVGTSLRSGTVQRLHISELGTIDQRYPNKSEEIKSGALNTVHENQIITIESTAKGQCYDKETEVLTNEGWKYFKDLNGNENILTVDENDNAYFQEKWQYYEKEWNDILYHFKSQKIDLLVSPEHKMWVQRQKGPWQFIKAKELYGPKTDLNFKKTFNWKGKKQKYFVLPRYKTKTNHGNEKIIGEKKIKMKDWLEYLGYFLTDGDCFYKKSHKGIRITQTQFPEKMIKCSERIAKQIGANSKVYNDKKSKRITIYNAQLANYLRDYSKPKRIPREILELNRESLKVLFEAMYLGDGDKGKRKQGESDFGRIWTGEYKELASDTQELILKTGYSSSIIKGNAKYYRDRGLKQNCWGVTNSEKKIAQLKTYENKIKKVHYRGKIYSVKLPKDHRLMVRRNGKAVWSGNTGVFFEYCKEALDNKTSNKELTKMDYKIFFFPWWKHPEYKLEGGVVIPSAYQEYFKKLEAKGIYLTKPQKNWYYKKRLQQKESMKTEFPSTPAEAFQANIEGAYFGKQMDRVMEEGRITKVPYDSKLNVDTWWDLGVDSKRSDAMSIVFTQTHGLEVRAIDFYGNSGEGLKHYKKVLDNKPYSYGRHYAPHDVKVKELGTGKTRLEVARSLGINFTVLPKLKFLDGIQAVRTILGRCWFDEEKTDELVRALKSYRKEWDDKLGKFKDRPLKDWASDPADAFRMMAIGQRDIDLKEKGYQKLYSDREDVKEELTPSEEIINPFNPFSL